jgi:two-component system nitrate/nitrite response regulator NarL
MQVNAPFSVLVVDDDPRVREALRELITAAGTMRVVASVGSLHDALKADERLAPDVALVDILLPDRADGIALVRALVDRGRRVVAASVAGASRADALAAGAACFVEKSPDSEPLLAALRHRRCGRSA